MVYLRDQTGVGLGSAAGAFVFCAAGLLAGVAAAQSSGPPTYYAPRGGDVASGGDGVRASWNPARPLSSRARQNGATLSHEYGMDFVTVGRTGNIGYVSGQRLNDIPLNGVGRVDYEYRIGRTEVPTAVWVDFYNAASYVSATQGLIPWVTIPDAQDWGAGVSGNYTGPGRRWVVAGQVFPSPTPQSGHMVPVGGISWRTAAIFCNWLHNDRALTRDAFMSGAYDVSTFGNRFQGFTDQAAHSPGARFWVPTHSEWLKAMHYDPQREAQPGTDPGSGGYWEYPTTSDTAPIYEPPEFGGEANSIFVYGGRGATVPLGAYENVQSPWGLFDGAGASKEWTETAVTFEFENEPNYRIMDGGGRLDSPFADPIAAVGGDRPSMVDWTYGLRIAAAVPSPGAGMILGMGLVMAARRKR